MGMCERKATYNHGQYQTILQHKEKIKESNFPQAHTIWVLLDHSTLHRQFYLSPFFYSFSVLHPKQYNLPHNMRKRNNCVLSGRLKINKNNIEWTVLQWNEYGKGFSKIKME